MRAACSALLVLVACGGGQRPAELGTQGGGDAGAESGDDGGVPSFGPVVAPSDDPATCEEAALWQSYVGCDYWPTVVANDVWSIFDFAVVVANAGSSPADVTVTGPMGVHQSQTVAPGELAKLYLPWVPALKGPDADSCGTSSPLPASVVAPGAAYHLVSSVPVTAYQFNALEYAGKGGPSGKDWSSCPGNQPCTDANSPNQGGPVGYRQREFELAPGQVDDPWWDRLVATGDAVAYNPSLSGGGKIEDTFLITPDGPELLTTSEEWPTIASTLTSGRVIPRPAILRA